MEIKVLLAYLLNSKFGDNDDEEDDEDIDNQTTTVIIRTNDDDNTNDYDDVYIGFYYGASVGLTR